MGCKQATSVLIDVDRRHYPMFLTGDLIRCTRCYCLGHVQFDTWGAYGEWQRDPCAKCYRDIDFAMEVCKVEIIEYLKTHDAHEVSHA